MRRNEQVSAHRLDCIDEMLRLSDLTGPGTGPGDVLGLSAIISALHVDKGLVCRRRWRCFPVQALRSAIPPQSDLFNMRDLRG